MPALARGEGGQAPAVLVAETAAGDYAFLDMATAAFISTHRASRAAPKPGPVDAFAYADRGVYRPGESVHLTALVRTRSGEASAVPVTLIFWRPDGVELSRVALADQASAGGRGARAVGHDGNLAREGAYRPEGRPHRQAAFLVEDFVHASSSSSKRRRRR